MTPKKKNVSFCWIHKIAHGGNQCDVIPGLARFGWLMSVDELALEGQVSILAGKPFSLARE